MTSILDWWPGFRWTSTENDPTTLLGLCGGLAAGSGSGPGLAWWSDAQLARQLRWSPAMVNALALAWNRTTWLVCSMTSTSSTATRCSSARSSQLVEHLPAHVHLLIGTRQDPGSAAVAMARSVASCWRFGPPIFDSPPPKTAEYLRSSGRVWSSPLRRLRTWPSEPKAGWPPSSSRRSRCAGTSRTLRRFIERFAGDDRYLVDYLMDEVLSGQSCADCRVPVAHSRPRPAERKACATPSPGSATVPRCSRFLERANLFVIPLDDQAIWFRYHHLFADLLRARLLAEQPELVAATAPASQ